jgi:protein SCO1/2
MAAPKKSPELKTPRLLMLGLAGLALTLAGLAIGLSPLAPGKAGSGASSPSGIGGAFRLETGGGRIVTDADFKGAPYLVFFGYTHCPDVCPTTLFQISEVLRALGPEAKIKAAFITVDPERDTPELMQNYAESFDPRIVGLSGDRAAIDKVVAAFRVYARKAPGANGDYTMDHSAVIYLMDRNGQFLRAFNLERPPEQAAAELKPLL